MYRYDELFFTYIQTGSVRSARRVVHVLASMLNPRSVADIGCGRGAWLKVWLESGTSDVLGVDGPYVPQEGLLVTSALFRSADLRSPIDLGRRFDLVTSFEVGEHLPLAASEAFVESLCRHAPIVAFSAAVPGQGGEQHVNEQPYEFWRDLFAKRGYRLFDCIRPLIAQSRDVEPWYRYNALLFVSDTAIARLPTMAQATRIADGAAVPDVSPPLFRFRKRLLLHAPVWLVDRLAIIKHRLIVLGERARLRRNVGVPVPNETSSPGRG